MSRFSKASDFSLVNNFTIEHADKLSDGRHFMSTCVPQGIWLDLVDIEFTHRVEWQDDNYEKRPPGSPDFKLRSVFTARGTTKDTITVFRVPDGEVARFSEVHVMVKPLPKGKIGVEKRSSTLDGVGFAGMASKVVPPEGLMTGEPGTLLYLDPTNDQWASEHDKPYLQLEGYIDEAEFSALMQRLSITAAPVRKATVRMVAELFEHEVDASLSEPWHHKDYGLLLRGDDKTYGVTRARVESVSVAFKPTAIPKVDPYEVDEPDSARPISMDNLPPDVISKISKDMLVKIERRLGILTSIVGFAAAFVVGKILLG
ncbi:MULTISPECIES: hypothetical protein [Sinorhizobium]|uniref:hypothetical protein n=1 Tax=Sinorhizobium TaxID=28105 RepID=UPI000BE8884E|nr:MULTISPECIES: hypothetical protein [Sinorhizobium]PDT50941.1 hypothetical protein CO664_24655 [Sinorhizobium sp. NG07B]POH25056.1 hypothetical protein ATY30_28890 [Sinorhizobium americanum]